MRKLAWQQQAELRDLEGRLQLQFEAEMARLQGEHSTQLLRLRCQHQEQVSPRLWALSLLLGGAGGGWRGASAA